MLLHLRAQLALWPFPVSDVMVRLGLTLCFWHYGQAWFIFLTQDRVEIILNCFVGSVHPQNTTGSLTSVSDLVPLLCGNTSAPILGVFCCANTCDFIATLPVAGRLHFNLDVNQILIHLAGFSCSMCNWVVCWNLPCSETCCWRSHKLHCWVHSMWILVATSQKMVSTAVISVWLSCFNMGLHCSAACCFAVHAWRAFLQFAIC